jgi:hypothetical protein
MSDTRVSYKGRTIAANFTRPSDTTAYASGDVVCNSTSAPVIMTFARASADAVSFIQQATLVDSANVATKPDLELWLFDTTITMDNDNAAFTPTDAELRTLIGVIAFPTASFKVGDATAGADGNSICDIQGLNIQVNTTPNTNAIFGVLVVRNAYVPVSGERFDVRLKLRD